MDLQQDAQGKQLKKGQTSDPLVYWVAFGVGGEKEAHALAKTVAEVKDGDLEPEAVDADEKLTITWGAIKSSKWEYAVGQKKWRLSDSRYPIHKISSNSFRNLVEVRHPTMHI